MSDTMAGPSAGAPPGGGARGRQRRPLPPWVWIVGAGALAAVYLLYARNKTSAGAQSASGIDPATGIPYATEAASAMQPAGAGSYGNGGDLASLLPYLQAAGNAGTGSTSGAYIPPSGETPQGAGFAPGPGGPTTLSDAQGNQYSFIPSAAAVRAASQTGQQIYYQPAAGVFVPISLAQLKTVGGAPTYLKVS